MHTLRISCTAGRPGEVREQVNLAGVDLMNGQAAQKRPSVADLLAHPWIVAHTPRQPLGAQQSVHSAPSAHAPETPSKEDTRAVSRAQVGFAASTVDASMPMSTKATPGVILVCYLRLEVPPAAVDACNISAVCEVAFQYYMTSTTCKCASCALGRPAATMQYSPMLILAPCAGAQVQHQRGLRLRHHGAAAPAGSAARRRCSRRHPGRSLC